MFGNKPKIPEITAQELHSMLQNGQDLFVLDVREPVEYQEAHIAGSTLIPLGHLAAQQNELPRDRQIVVSCRSGNRSGMATDALIRAGYNAINLAGGLIEWKRLELPVERS